LTEPLEFRFPPELEHLRCLRRHLRTKLDELGVSADAADNVLLVVDEVVTNAIEHSDPYRVANGHLTVKLSTSGNDILLDFEDPDVPETVVRQLAAMLSNGPGNRPPPEFERGRGLFLIAHHVDRLEISLRPKGGMHLHGRFPGALE
jgi:anti-sigma regulatory factor (Ser/Thr protein kinase)